MKFEEKYKFEDYVGKQINHLKAIRESKEKYKDGSRQWEFKCVCGKIIIEPPSRVISGHIKSCGCMRYKREHSKVKDRSKMSRIDIEEFIGKKNNLLTVIGIYRPESGGRAKLKCLCDCGNETYVYPYQFNSGDVQSCGCLRKHIWGGKRELPWMYKHGYSKDRLYKKFTRIKQRCYNPDCKQYDRYGGSGITICKEWLDSPEKFVEWAIENGGLDEKLTIDRIDGSGPYSPDNCRFVSVKEQQRNLKSNRIIEFNGESHCLAEWAEILGFKYSVLANRLHRGWSIERALTEPVKQCKNLKSLLN